MAKIVFLDAYRKDPELVSVDTSGKGRSMAIAGGVMLVGSPVVFFVGIGLMFFGAILLCAALVRDMTSQR